jgi:hypothetical protein
VRIGKGQGKRIVLRVKSKVRGKVAKRNRLLFKQTMRVGAARTTVYRNLKLVRRAR